MEGNSMLAPLYELADGDKVFFIDMLQSMAAAIPADIAAIENAIEQKHITLLCRNAHHMKSSIMYSNAAELKALLAMIESQNESAAAIDEIKSLLPKLKGFAEVLLALIHKELAN